MKTFTKRLCLLVVTLLLYGVAKANNVEVDGIYYSLDDVSKTAEVICNEEIGLYSGDVVIPSVVTSDGVEYTVTGIEEVAFAKCSNLTSVVIPNSVRGIGGNAFAHCYKLTSITIPNSVEFIEYNAFSGCSSLTSIIIPDKVTTIRGGVFRECTSLASVTIPNSVTSIACDAFCGCSSLASVTIPNSVTDIASGAFYGCSSLASVTIPNSVTSIGSSAFSGCTSLADIYVEEGNETYKSIDGVLLNKEGTQILIFPEGKTGSYTIPNTITEISYNTITIGNRVGITSILIPKSVSYITWNVFNGCSNLTNIDVEEGNEKYKSIDGVLFNKEGTQILIFPAGKTGAYTVPNTVEIIGAYAFEDCTKLTSITIPNRVVQIRSYAFWGCTADLLIWPEGERDVELSFQDNTFYNFKGVVYAPEKHIPNIAHYWSGEMYSIDNAYSVIDLKPYIRAMSFKLKENKYFKEKCTVTDVLVGNDTDGYKSVSPDENGVYKVSGLQEASSYKIKVICSSENGNTYEILKDVVTSEVKINYSFNCTQTTLSVTVWATSDETCTVEKMGIYFNGTEYYMPADGRSIVVSGLIPHTWYSFTPFAYYDSHVKNIPWNGFYTKSLYPKLSVEKASPTSLIVKGSYTEGDAHVSETGFEEYGIKGNTLSLTGLLPERKYTFTYYVRTEEGGYETRSWNATTPKLTFTNLTPKVTNNGTAIVCAETNIADEETSVGFEWRKTDAPDVVVSKSGTGIIFNGVMEGKIQNLSTDSYYKVRPFYKSASGSVYYGEWIGFDPSDFSYFEPTVHTYDNVAVNGVSAVLTGYAMEGSDNITKQGFEYWKSGSSKAKGTATAQSESVYTITATGQRMTAELSGLEPYTNYVCRAFVTTDKGTTYGEEVSFTTGSNPTGIEEVKVTGGIPDLKVMSKEHRLLVSLSGNGEGNVTVYGLNGRVAARQSVVCDGEWHCIDATLAPGVYIVKARNSVGVKTVKVYVK